VFGETNAKTNANEGKPMTDLLLYHAVPSRSMTIHWLLEELGEPYEIELLNLEAEDHQRPEYLAINPMRRVPTLVHGDVVVTETAAICAYVADAFPDANLGVPVDSPLRGSYYRWLFFAPVSAEPAILWRALGEVKTEVDYRPFAEVEDVADTLRSAVAGREFVVGDQFTVADIRIGTTIMWGTRLMPVLPAHPELVEYWERLGQRPAWQRAYAEDQALMAG
jgi:glutathione S-transferase